MARIGWWTRTSGKLVALVSRGLSKRTSDLHLALYRRTGGRLGGNIGPLPTLLLTTTGRKSGRPRTVPINYLRDGADYVVIASNSGRDAPPLWLLNLQSDPHATIEIGAATLPVLARPATAEEQSRLWPKLISRAYNYEEYRNHTARPIPLLILQPQERQETG